MTKEKSSAKRLARELQEETGRPYRACLEEAKALLERDDQESGQEAPR